SRSLAGCDRDRRVSWATSETQPGACAWSYAAFMPAGCRVSGRHATPWSRIRQCLETEGPDGERLRRGIQTAARKSVLLQAIDEGASAESQPARSLRLVSGDRGKGAGNDASFEGFDLLAQAKAGIEGRLGRLVRGIGRGASRGR